MHALTIARAACGPVRRRRMRVGGGVLAREAVGAGGVGTDDSRASRTRVSAAQWLDDEFKKSSL